MRTLVVAGCSHTAGSEILPKPDDGFCYDKAWGGLLSKKLNYKHINLAHPGAGNNYIVRSIFDWVQTCLEEKVDLKQHTLVVMWSSFDRYEIIYPDSKQHRHFGVAFTNDNTCTMYNPETAELQKLNILFNDKLQSFYNNLQLMYSLKLFLEKFSIEYYFVNGITNFEPPVWLDSSGAFFSSYTKLLKLFGPTENFLGFYNLKDTFYHYLKDVKKFKYSQHSTNRHFGEDAHIEWSNVIYDKYFVK